MIDYEKIEKAIKFVSKYMGNMKKLGKPTLLHSINVGTDLIKNNYDTDICVAGFLHDMIEDTKIDAGLIEKEFGNRILDLILANSKNYNLDKKEIDQELFDRCLEFGKEAMVIKACDIFDNRIYFSKTEEIDKVNRVKSLGETFVSILTNDYDDFVFDRLKKIFG